MKKKWYETETWKGVKEMLIGFAAFLAIMCFGMLLYWLSFIPFPPGTLGP